MNILFFDATNDWLVVEIYNFTDTINLKHSLKGFFPRESSFRLVKEISIALEKSEIEKPDLIIACNGPGSFTGIRICVSTARNLAQIWNIPVVGINSIEFYCGYYFEKEKKSSIVLIEGGQNKFFSAMMKEDRFDGCYDISKEEVFNTFSVEKSNCNIYSTQGKIENSKDINSDIPGIQFFLKELLKRNISLNEYNYNSLKPNYMRGTYAKEKKK
ncbi:MAG: tRNA (adenosine(37)-N6)-threonylcarbamoyltransferase complex dimerization subunit type 1 TsaB [Leptospiraceae bacterium]|nr:tRNA (adenosine(37)-N6)-threonylcarbamoyltransferase complex dimerization subunit type 1 TsaB [Leptospiraceae bacterium]MCK6381568.1 tRNA (adenosine(37)-N6)-threonylcarbamoyltransferase complex dimerization subunit type 1 TsaB [Leptospiraceae bacterium]NUM41669.1 tRNA (adenosine(37)-N6)-threonylcarbamoyltransferase complex dimerization subunit type 1 TsaB [Leptospiraceae bacterium]